MPDNPFIPSFGVSPLYLAGRGDAIASIRDVSLNLARTDYSRASLIIGQRGIGKTVLLNAVEDTARDDNWIMVKTTATRGFLRRMITEQLQPIMETLKPSRNSKLSAGVTIGSPIAKGDVRIEELHKSETVVGFRDIVYSICKAAPDRGLLFTVDEINSRARDELEEFASVYQHAIREGLNVALVMCGIPGSLSSMLSQDKAAMTFLNRSNKVEIGLLEYGVAKHAFSETIRVRGTKRVPDDVLGQMAALSKGYPFLVQEIGNKAWDVNPDSDTITLDNVKLVMQKSLVAMNDSVLRPIYRSLTDRLQEALRVIAQNPGIRTSDLGKKLGIPTTAVSGLHQRLIEAGVIIRAKRGVTRISIPYMEQFLCTGDTQQNPDVVQLAILDGYPDVNF